MKNIHFGNILSYATLAYCAAVLTWLLYIHLGYEEDDCNLYGDAETIVEIVKESK